MPRRQMMKATQPVALVTGASSGIGKATALALVASGFAVVGTSRDASRVTPARGVTLVDLDVTSDESVAAAVGQVIERFGRIDVLVNNAGVGSSGASEESSVAQDQIVFDVNVFGLIRMTKAVLPHMRAQESGRVINMSSTTDIDIAHDQSWTIGSTFEVDASPRERAANNIAEIRVPCCRITEDDHRSDIILLHLSVYVFDQTTNTTLSGEGWPNII